MHILLIPAFFQEKKRPTLGSFFLDQARALVKAGNQVTILYCDTFSIKCIKDSMFYAEKEEETIDGVQIYRKKYFCPMKHGLEGHREQFAKGILELYQKWVQDRTKIDMIHAHCAVWAGYAAMQLSEATKIPYVITEHSTLFQLHADQIHERNRDVIRKTFQQAREVICVSHAFGRLLSEYRKEIQVVGNVVDCNRFTLQNRTSEEKGQFRFLTVCYMQEQDQLYKKGIDILLDAFAQVVKENPNVELLIGGDGNARKIAEEWVRTKGLAEYVHFLGALKREQVAEQMAACDCFVLPSRYETFGVVYIESLACGRPVIGVKNGGPDDFVNEQNGILVESENVMQLVQAMGDMIAHAKEYDPMHMRNEVEGSFSEEAVAHRLEEIYASILESCE